MSGRNDGLGRRGPKRRVSVLGAVLAANGLLACSGGEPPAAPPSPAVVVDVARIAPLADYREYVGNVRAMDRVEVRARVRGYLVEQRFADGARVAKGDVLFRIDPEPFQIALAEAKGKLASAHADAVRAAQDLARAEALFQRGVVSDEIIDQRRAARDATAAAETAAKASVRSAELNLSYAEVRAPVAGRMGRALIDVGNLVGESGTDTILAELVEEDPIHVYFAASEGEALPHRTSKSDAPIPVQVLLGDGTRYPHEGVVDYVAPTVDADLGTLSVRARVPNPEGLLRPGQFVRVIAHFPDIAGAVLVPQRAVLDEQGGSYVLLVGADDKVERRPIRPGRMVDGQQEILAGLAGGERVIVDGSQTVRPGDTVRATSAEAQPAQAKPADAKPAETRPADANPADASKKAEALPPPATKPAKTPEPPKPTSAG
jgi:membrane fusion protein (multidrug efflux system)